MDWSTVTRITRTPIDEDMDTCSYTTILDKYKWEPSESRYNLFTSVKYMAIHKVPHVIQIIIIIVKVFYLRNGRHQKCSIESITCK